MGGNGSGRYSIVSKGFDILDHYWATLNQLERSLYDPSHPITPEGIDAAKTQLRGLQDQFKSAIERERA